jgi:hypothetical protein
MPAVQVPTKYGPLTGSCHSMTGLSSRVALPD